MSGLEIFSYKFGRISRFHHSPAKERMVNVLLSNDKPENNQNDLLKSIISIKDYFNSIFKPELIDTKNQNTLKIEYLA